MSRSWRLFVPVMLMLLTLVAAPAAAASSPVTNTRQIVREAVSWTLPADQCPDLPAGVSVTGNGQRFLQIFTKTFADGSRQEVDNDLVKGTALGSNGQTYNWVYHNKATLKFPVSATDPVQVQMSDSFVMTAKGGVKGINVGFHWRWTYTPPAGIFDVLPPANLRADFTKGDPFACDPI